MSGLGPGLFLNSESCRGQEELLDLFLLFPRKAFSHIPLSFPSWVTFQNSVSALRLKSGIISGSLSPALSPWSWWLTKM